MLDNMKKHEKNISILIKFLPLLSFIIPFLVLYFLYPASFEMTWKGRTFYLFFLWLVCLEMILSWEDLQSLKHKLKSIKTVIFTIVLLLPSIYVIAANYSGLNMTIADLAKAQKIPWADKMPLSTEYLVFTVLFGLAILATFGINSLMDFSTSVLFLGIIGFVYTMDNMYPYGSFTPFQIFVPMTATLAANILSFMGYQTAWLGEQFGTPVLKAWNSKGSTEFGIAWPCSGVESLIIYSVTILLFLKKSAISLKQRIIYFVIGAMVTYFINVLRVVTIFVISINTGGGYTIQTQQFHDYYGQLYSLIWIISYPLIILGSRALWGKIRNWKTCTKGNVSLQNQTKVCKQAILLISD